MAIGRLITFEGGEGSGKSTQARRLSRELEARGIDVVLTREPGGTPFAERVRTLILDPATPAHGALSEALLFYAARADHLAALIRPALARGAWVVCDRFSDSTFVYQSVAGGLGADAFVRLQELVVAPTVPDLTFVLDLPAEVGLQRARRRPSVEGGMEDTYQRRDLAFHQRLREGFRQLALAEPGRCRLIDGSAPEEDVARAIWSAAVDRLGPP